MLDSYTKSQILNVLSIALGIVGLLIAVYQFSNPQTGTILFIGILIFIALYFIISYPIAILKYKFNQINECSLGIENLKKDLNKLKDNIDIIINMSKMNAKISFLEKELLRIRNKKGQIDPRWILIIIILILILLYLRSKGII